MNYDGGLAWLEQKNGFPVDFQGYKNIRFMEDVLGSTTEIEKDLNIDGVKRVLWIDRKMICHR